MLIIKKLAKQSAPFPSASIMILQKGIAISLEWWHLVLTLLARSYNLTELGNFNWLFN